MKYQTPEALAEFAKSARAAEPRKEDKSLAATAKTAPKPRDLKTEQNVATKVLQQGATGQNKDAIAAVKKLPDRIIQSR
jgi:hypothetical protein